MVRHKAHTLPDGEVSVPWPWELIPTTRCRNPYGWQESWGLSGKAGSILQDYTFRMCCVFPEEKQSFHSGRRENVNPHKTKSKNQKTDLGARPRTPGPQISQKTNGWRLNRAI